MIKKLLLTVLVILAALGIALYTTTYHPADIEASQVTCPADTPELRPGASVKILNWNVQYMGSKDHVFWYDLPDGDGPDLRPSPENIAKTLDEVARIVSEEQPDIVVLQEVNDGAGYTDYDDQLELLLEQLPPEYRCHTDAFYWRASFVPHPKVWTSVGMKLATISKHKIDKSTRHQLPRIPGLMSQLFNFDRAVLQVEFPIAGGGTFHSLNTHLDAFAQGSNTMELQVGKVHAMLGDLEAGKDPWIISGDFNLLPPGFAVNNLPEQSRVYYNEPSEVQKLFDDFPSTVSAELLSGPASRKQYFTYFSNHPDITEPDRTLDYVFYSRKLAMESYGVRSRDTLHISDHFPMIAKFRLPAAQ